MGFRILATRGTADFLKQHGVEAEVVFKVYEGRPNVVDYIKNREIHLLINTSSGRRTVSDSSSIRQAAVLYNIPYATTVSGANAMALAIQELAGKGMGVKSLQEYYAAS